MNQKNRATQIMKPKVQAKEDNELTDEDGISVRLSL